MPCPVMPLITDCLPRHMIGVKQDLKDEEGDHMVLLQAALVVYDEIHYLRDKERGVVWEESIVLMPKSVRFAFLSATIPNAMEFAEWIAKTHR